MQATSAGLAWDSKHGHVGSKDSDIEVEKSAMLYWCILPVLTIACLQAAGLSTSAQWPVTMLLTLSTGPNSKWASSYPPENEEALLLRTKVLVSNEGS